MSTEQFTPFNDEWKKEMKKLPKEVIIDLFSEVGVSKSNTLDALKEIYELVKTAHFVDGNQLTPFPTRSCLDRVKKVIDEN